MRVIQNNIQNKAMLNASHDQDYFHLYNRSYAVQY